ncbi:MAG: hypothetical protein BroJett003_20230 [Planctomycetota bacterium]|nr:MAG: hypothetical protein BroJett003_20230 [Planctomycetota bacterium]
MLALLMPTRIEIVKPSTRLRGAGGAVRPESLEVLVRGFTVLDNPGALLVGQIRFELFMHQPASGHIEGQRIHQWDIDLGDEENQRRFWNPVIQMYEFSLGVDPAVIPPANKYVLAATLNTPLGQHLSDDLVFELLEGPSGVTVLPPPGR